MHFGKAVILLGALASSGCASHVFSSSASGATDQVGIPYALPRALIPIRVIARGPDVFVDVGQPIYGPDPTARYILKYGPNAANSDTVKVTVDPKSGFISSIATTVTGDVDTAVVNAAKSIASLTAESQVTKDLDESETLLLDVVVDPATILQPAFDTNLQKQLTDYRTQSIATCTKAAADARKEAAEKKAAEEAAKAKGKKPAKPPAKPAPAPTAAEVAAQAALDAKELAACTTPFAGLVAPQLSISLRDALPTFTPNTGCSLGVCHRAAAENVVMVTFNGRTISRGVMLPNGQPAQVIPLDRPWFADGWKTDITFEDGYVKSLDIDHKSDAAEGLALPFNAVGGAINALGTSLIGLKKTKLDEQKELLDSKLAYAQKKKELDEELKEDTKEEDDKKAESETVAPGDWYPVLISISSTGAIRKSNKGGLQNGPPPPAGGKQPAEQTGNGLDGSQQSAGNEGGGVADAPAPAPKAGAKTPPKK